VEEYGPFEEVKTCHKGTLCAAQAQKEASMSGRIRWPDGKDFAFTIFDDTDCATCATVREVYAFVRDCGLRTTKSVWPVRGQHTPVNGGDTCAEPEYRAWVVKLQSLGFEIGYHMTTYHSSVREETRAGLETFAELFGQYPATMANHVGCTENLYWGSARVSGVHQVMYNLLTRYRNHNKFRGHIAGDAHFWGDMCKAKVKYVRNFVFPEINTLKACPWMPYHDPKRPFVNYWYSASEGADITSFNRMLAEKNQDRLEAEHGACIMYTHFGKGFYQNGVDRQFQRLMHRLSQKNGWFVPVSTLLDYIVQTRGHHTITEQERKRLERKWLLAKVTIGTT
jgi:hypothetical protein